MEARGNNQDGNMNVDTLREDDPDTQCGFGTFRPGFLQIFARIGAFVSFYSLSGLLTSTLAVYINSQVTMLEKQFGFSSAETGFLMSCNDIGFLSCILFCGFIARKVHIPRGLGISTILYGICGIMCSLPYFIQDHSSYDIDQKPNNLDIQTNITALGGKVPMCVNDTSNGDIDRCSADTDVEGVTKSMTVVQQLHIKKVAYYIIAIGMVFQGVGKSVRYPFIGLYVDDAVDKRKTGFYMGIIIGTAIFGPALAYLVGGLFNNIYITLEKVDITPKDPRWIGAWWLGFLVFGACSVIFSLPIMLFPRKLKSKSRMKDLEMTGEKMEHATHKSAGQTFVKEVKDFGKTIWRLLRNPIYITIVLSSVISVIGLSGMLSFMPKYLVIQYTIPLWKSNIIIAISTISALAMGSFLGGLVSRRVEMTPRTSLKLLLIFDLINLICMSTGFFLGCDQPTLVGDNGHGHELNSLYSPIEPSCILGCSCDDGAYFPACGEDGRTYFSPCHAGCTEQIAQSFFNCTCINSGKATPGLCDQGCSSKLYIYSAITFIGRFVDAFKIIPIIIVNLRCVEERPSICFGIFWIFIVSVRMDARSSYIWCYCRWDMLFVEIHVWRTSVLST
ncbi:solute carrier organic anion transporter family member 2B1-like [Ruditapes philippinarum]|uniref:solute carrier organic anion transporter family member 2B1-like n=1 Tax=Ruditapes philippinarum TaxID=129788 RepID=UPI00295B1662|nr:solute carrier organic anion transporter family member 2B1-like [Ruditapes philippinarum]